jgi:ABC-type transporter Mla subunit MlaD
MEDKYDPKETIEIIISSKKYLDQTIGEAKNILSQNAPKILDSLDSLLKFMNKRTISNNNTYFNYVKEKPRLDKEDQIKPYIYMFNNYLMAGIVKHISEYAKNLDPKDPDYNEKINHIKKFIDDLEDRNIFDTFYMDSLKRVSEKLDGKKEYTLKDYNDILKEMSNDLTDNVEDRLKYLIKNIEQFYKDIRGTRRPYMSKLTKPLYKIFRKVRNIFYH